MLKLVIEDDEGRKTVVPFVREEITIGRQEGNTIRLTERNVSRRHARLVRHNGSVLVEDLGSYNGIRINGEKIQGQVPIRDGDLIQIGDYDLAIQSDAAAAAGAHVNGEATTNPVPSSSEVPTPNPTAEQSRPGEITAKTEVEMAAVPEPLANAELTPSARRAATAIIRMDGADEPTATGKPEEIDPAQAPRLVVLNTEFAGREFACIRSELKLGRTDENDINVDHRSLSRIHARLVREASGDWRIADLQSANGMTVNGEPYAQCVLRNGDVVELGHVRFRFVGAGETYRFVPGADQPPRRGSSKAPLFVLALLLLGGAAAAVYLFVLPKLGPVPVPGSEPGTETVKSPDSPEANPPNPGTPSGAQEVESKLRTARDAFAVKKFEKAKDVLESLRAGGAELPKDAEELLAQTELELSAKQALTNANRALGQNNLAEAAAALEGAKASVAFSADYAALVAKLDAARAKEPVRKPNAREHRNAAVEKPVEKAPERVSPPVPDKLADEGFALLKGKQYDKALAVLKKCVDVDVGFARCHKGLGAAYAKLREPEKGAFHYRKYVQLAPNEEDTPKVRKYLDEYEASRKPQTSN